MTTSQDLQQTAELIEEIDGKLKNVNTDEELKEMGQLLDEIDQLLRDVADHVDGLEEELEAHKSRSLPKDMSNRGYD